MTPTTLLWIRHGDARAAPGDVLHGHTRAAAPDVAPDALHGHTDVALSPAGRAQAAAAAKALVRLPVAALYASDLIRARDTAAPAATALGLEARPRKALRERHFGAWEGASPATQARDAPDAWGRMWHDPDFAPPGGESLAALAARVLPAVAEIVAAHPGALVAVVAHGGPVRVAVGDVLGLSLPGIARLSLTHGGGTLVRHFPDGVAQVLGINLPPGAWPDALRGSAPPVVS